MSERSSRRPLRPLLVVPIVVAILALGVAATFIGWRLTRGPASVSEPGSRSPALAAIARMPDPSGYVEARAGKEDPATFNQLVQAYQGWVSRPDALPARRQIVSALLGHPDIRIGLEALLTAVDADPTPRLLDPMWPALVDAVSARWDAVTFPLGRDLVALELRPRAKDLLLDSLTAVRPEKLADSQKPLLASDLIDMYPGLRPDQRPGVEKALTALAGPDIVKILHGQGLQEGSTDLQIVADKQRAIENVLRHPVPDKPAEE